MNYPLLRLQKDQERRLLAGHHWIYSNEVDNKATPLKQFSAGMLVNITSAKGQPLGIGYVNPNTLLCARLLTRQSHEVINTDFFIKRIEQALAWRQQCFSQPYYRLIYSESDYLSGLIIDRFGDTLVGQLNTAGMQQLAPMILDALLAVIKPQCVIWRNDNSYRELEGLTLENKVAYGDALELGIVEENNCHFHTPFFTGQKTGWFYDHRLNRAAITHYVKDKKVLDVFSYLGAFAIPAAKAGAKQVTCIDASATATNLILQNAKLNQVEDKIKILNQDAFLALEQLIAAGEKFDIVIVDPPAFIKRSKDSKAGSLAYQRINMLALQLLNSYGVLLSASCSMHLSRDELLNILRKASLKTQKIIRILEQLHQAPDHPIHAAIAETNYLKGFILGVN